MAATLSFNLAGAFKGLSLSSSSSVRGDVAPMRVGMPSQLHIKPRSLAITCAHKMGGGSTKNGRDSPGQRLGVKIYGNQVAKPGSIIIRQRGTKFYPGNNVGIGKDHTIYSLLDGLVKFETFGPQHKQKVSVYPLVEQPENPDSYRVKKREFFRLRRERRKAKKEAWKNGALAPQLVLASAEELPEGSPAC